MKEEKLIDIVRKISKKIKDKNGKLHEVSWSDSYFEKVEICEDVSVHAQKNKFPEKMMKTRAPNETDEELKYRKDNFESITMPYWYRAVASISGRVWSEQNHTITFSDEEIEKYFTQEYPVYGSIIEYFRQIVTPYKINDPNAVLALRILNVPTKVDDDGEEYIDESGLVTPSLQIYGCHKVLKYKISEYALIHSDLKSEVDYNGKKEETGLVFWLYDTEAIYKIYQVGKKIEWTFAVEEYYRHDLGYLPVWTLKGILKTEIKDTEPDLVYYSYFTPAIPLLNKALKQDSTLDASVSKTAFPVRTYYEDECDEPTCQGGKIPEEYSDGGVPTKWKNCGKCGGSGKGGIKFSPLKDHVLRPPKKTLTDEEVALPFPAFAYVSPDTTILQFLDEKIKAEIIEAFTFINIDVSKSDNTGDQTAIEVKIDREELFAFLKQFSADVFDLLKWGLKTLIKIRYNEEDIVSISPPKTFEIYSADELTVELSEAKKAGIPENGIREMTKDFMSKRFSQQGDLPKITEVVFNADAYATKDTMEIVSLKAQNLIQLWQVILHEEIYQFIDVQMQQNPNFLELPANEQNEALWAMAKARAAEQTPRTAANIVNEIA